MKYSKPEITMAGSAVKAIQNPNPVQKLVNQIEDFGDTTGLRTHTAGAYAADE